MLHLLAIIQHTIPSFLNSLVFFSSFIGDLSTSPEMLPVTHHLHFYRRRNRGSDGADIAGKRSHMNLGGRISKPQVF